jgi:SAM-dependent methyltransferase
MKYYKNIDISKEFAVSQTTVANWIKDTLSGKKDLELISHKNKKYIAKTEENITKIKAYASEGFKYKPTNARTVSSPKEEFKKYLTDRQLIEIKKNIVDKKKIDVKFSYIDGGANIWDKMYDESAGSSATYDPYNQMNILSIPRILELTGKKKINIIEIGAGNGKPLLEFLNTLTHSNRLNAYISIDISSEMNALQEQNLLKSFPGLNFFSYVVDVENESFDHIVYEIYQDHPDTMNIFVVFGGTFGNFADIERTVMNIEKSMLSGDIVCINNPRPHKDRYADGKYMYESPTVDHYLFASRSLGLQVSGEDLRYEFDKKTTTRKLFLNIPHNHTVKLLINDREEVIDLPKGTEIMI